VASPTQSAERLNTGLRQQPGFVATDPEPIPLSEDAVGFDFTLADKVKGRVAVLAGKTGQVFLIMATWPAYRVSNSQFKTMQWRINDCYRQMRMPEPVFGSEATVAMNMFLTTTAKGETYRGPGTKR
jgi:hypothetical protein